MLHSQCQFDPQLGKCGLLDNRVYCCMIRQFRVQFLIGSASRPYGSTARLQTCLQPLIYQGSLKEVRECTDETLRPDWINLPEL